MRPGETDSVFYGNDGTWVRCRLLTTTDAASNQAESGMSAGESWMQLALAVPAVPDIGFPWEWNWTAIMVGAGVIGWLLLLSRR